MKWIFNKVFIYNNLEIFYAYVGVIFFMIILTIVFVAREIKKQNDNK